MYVGVCVCVCAIITVLRSVIQPHSVTRGFHESGRCLLLVFCKRCTAVLLSKFNALLSMPQMYSSCKHHHGQSGQSAPQPCMPSPHVLCAETVGKQYGYQSFQITRLLPQMQGSIAFLYCQPITSTLFNRSPTLYKCACRRSRQPGHAQKAKE